MEGQGRAIAVGPHRQHPDPGAGLHLDLEPAGLPGEGVGLQSLQGGDGAQDQHGQKRTRGAEAG